jgi:DNA polymerase-3 subunit beta
LAAQKEFLDRGPAAPSLSPVRLTARDDRLTVHGSGIDHALAVRLQWSGDDLDATVDASALAKIAAVLPDAPVTLSTKDGHIAVVAGGFAFTLVCRPPDELPRFPEEAVEAAFELPAHDVGEALRFVAPAISTDEARYPLNGFNVRLVERKILFVATEGYRIHLASIDAPDTLEALPDLTIHLRALQPIRRAIADDGADVSFKFGKTLARIEIGRRTIATKLIDSPFPRYERLMPTGSTGSITIQGDDLAALAAATDPLDAESRMIRFRPHASEASCLNAANGSMTARLDIEVEGKVPDLFCLDAAHVRDLVQAFRGRVVLNLREDPVYPLLATFEDSRFSAVLAMARCN